MHVRRARHSDADAIAGIYVRSWRDAGKQFLPSQFLASLSVEEHASTWADAIELGTQRIRVVEMAGVLVGFASFGLSRDEGAGATDFELQAIYVDPPSTGSGAGFALWVQCFEEMRLASASRVMLWVLEKDVRLIRFYQAAGFVQDAGARRSVELGGVPFDEVRYAQKIRR